MCISALPYELKKVSARIVKAAAKNAKYINSICDFEDLEYTDELFLKIGNRGLDFGIIENVEVSYKNGKEYWEITTMNTYFKFQILNKPHWVEVKKDNNRKKTDVERFEKRRAKRELDEAFDAFLNRKINFSDIIAELSI